MTMSEFEQFMPNRFLIVMGKMNATIHNRIEGHMKSLGFNTTEFLIMYAVAAHGKLTIQDIAARIFVTSGNMTYTIDKLEKKGILKRIPCPEDRRRIFVDFTEQGQSQWDIALDDHSRFLNDLFADIDEQLMSQTIEHMKFIGKNV